MGQNPALRSDMWIVPYMFVVVVFTSVVWWCLFCWWCSMYVGGQCMEPVGCS